jgi:hypothetical protein
MDIANGPSREIVAAAELPFKDALNRAVEFDGTFRAFMAKAADVVPAGTTNAAGTVNSDEVEERETVLPPAGAAFERATVQLPVVLESNEAGVHCNEVIRAGTISETTEVAEPPFNEAVRFAAVSDSKAPARRVNVADKLPAATVRNAGTVTGEEVVVSPTLMPSAGAGFDRVTVQLPVVPGPRDGVHCNDVTVTGATREIVEACELPFSAAATTAVVSEGIVPTLMLKLTDVAPLAMPADAGTVSRGEFAVTESDVAEAAGLDKATLHVLVLFGFSAGGVH